MPNNGLSVVLLLVTIFFTVYSNIEITRFLREEEAEAILFSQMHFRDWYKEALYEKEAISNSTRTLQEVRRFYGASQQWNATTKRYVQHLQLRVVQQKKRYEAIVTRYNANARTVEKHAFLKRRLPQALPKDERQLE